MKEKILILVEKGDYHIPKIKEFIKKNKELYDTTFLEVSFHSDRKFRKIELPKSFKDFDRVEIVYVIGSMLVPLLHPEAYAEKCNNQDVQEFVKSILNHFFREVKRVLKNGGVISINDFVPSKNENFLDNILKRVGFRELRISSAIHDWGAFCQIFRDIKNGIYIYGIK